MRRTCTLSSSDGSSRAAPRTPPSQPIFTTAPGPARPTARSATAPTDEWVAAGQPPPGSRPGEGTSIGRRRLISGDIVDWRRYAVGMATPEVADGIDYAPLWAGESCSVVNDIKPAAQIVA